MTQDAFSGRHPLVNFLFFLAAMVLSVLIQHPAYVLLSILSALSYHLFLQGRKGLKKLAGLLVLFVFLTVINPLFNTRGEEILFSVFGRPYTLEALYYGSSVAGVFVSMLLWFGCYSQVLTSDKFSSLFGSAIPSLSLLLVMVFRMVPNFIRKTRQITAARRTIGKGVAQGAGLGEKVRGGLTVMDTLTGWALEGGIVTGDSMRARGYGSGKRTSFQLYAWKCKDFLLLGCMLLLLTGVIFSITLGHTAAEFTPSLNLAPLSWGLAPYGAFLLIPTILRVKEELIWHISRSGI